MVDEAKSYTKLLDIIHTIINTRFSGVTRIVAIDGRGGSGKSTLARKLVQTLDSFSIAETDWFPCFASEFPLHRTGTQTRVSTQRILENLLLSLKKGRKTTVPQYSFWDTTRQTTVHEIKAGGTLILEGCYSMHRDLREYIDFGLFIDCSRSESIARASRRDGRESLSHWEEIYAPNEDAYLASHHPELRADLILRVHEVEDMVGLVQN